MRHALLPLICFGFMATALPAAHAADPAPAKKPSAPPAQKTTSVSPDSIPILQEWQKKTGATLDHMGSRHGMDAWISMRNGVMMILYTTPDKQAMIINNQMIGPNGQDATSELQREFVVNNGDRAQEILSAMNNKMRQPVSLADPAELDKISAKPSKSLQFWFDLAKANYISFGVIDTPMIYMLVDLKCDHCADLWTKMQPMLDAKKISIRVVPIAILGKESEDAASRLLSQPDPATAWRNHIAGKDLTSTPSDSGQAAFKLNQELVPRYKLNSTPVLLYREPEKRTVRMVLGNPNDLTGIWQDLGVDTEPAPAAPMSAMPHQEPQKDTTK